MVRSAVSIGQCVNALFISVSKNWAAIRPGFPPGHGRGRTSSGAARHAGWTAETATSLRQHKHLARNGPQDVRRFDRACPNIGRTVRDSAIPGQATSPQSTPVGLSAGHSRTSDESPINPGRAFREYWQDRPRFGHSRTGDESPINPGRAFPVGLSARSTPVWLSRRQGADCNAVAGHHLSLEELLRSRGACAPRRPTRRSRVPPPRWRCAGWRSCPMRPGDVATLDPDLDVEPVPETVASDSPARPGLG